MSHQQLCTLNGQLNKLFFMSSEQKSFLGKLRFKFTTKKERQLPQTSTNGLRPDSFGCLGGKWMIRDSVESELSSVSPLQHLWCQYVFVPCRNRTLINLMLRSKTLSCPLSLPSWHHKFPAQAWVDDVRRRPSIQLSFYKKGWFVILNYVRVPMLSCHMVWFLMPWRPHTEMPAGKPGGWKVAGLTSLTLFNLHQGRHSKYFTQRVTTFPGGQTSRFHGWKLSWLNSETKMIRKVLSTTKPSNLYLVKRVSLLPLCRKAAKPQNAIRENAECVLP